MKRTALALALSVGMALTVSCTRQPGDPDPSADPPRWLLINYWAVWCAPCRSEIPELNRLAAEHADRLRVLGVNFDGLEGPDLAASVEQMGIAFATAPRDPAAQYGITRPKVLPTTFLIDPTGRLRHELQGPQTYHGLLALVGADARPAAEED